MKGKDEGRGERVKTEREGGFQSWLASSPSTLWKGVKKAWARSLMPFSLPPIDVGCGLAGPKKPGRWTQYILGGRGRERVTVGFCLFPFWPPNYTYYLVTTSIYSTKIHPYLSLDYRLDQFETVETTELNCCVFSFSVDCVEWLSVLCVDDQKEKRLWTRAETWLIKLRNKFFKCAD